MTTILLILIGLSILGLLLYSLLGPRESWELYPRDGHLTRLRESRDAFLRAIIELREDYEAGRLSEEEFERSHRRLKGRAIRCLLLLEKLREVRSRQIRSTAALSPAIIRRVEQLVATRKESS